MDDGLTLNEIELRLFLLKKDTKSAIERNDAYISRLKQTNRQRDELLASLQGLAILDDESLYRSETSSLSHSTCSEHSFATRSSFDSSLDESRDDEESVDHSTGSMECKRHGIVEDSSGSSKSTPSSSSLREEAIQQEEKEQEKRI